jgi:hypothetical protein
MGGASALGFFATAGYLQKPNPLPRHLRPQMSRHAGEDRRGLACSCPQVVGVVGVVVAPLQFQRALPPALISLPFGLYFFR